MKGRQIEGIEELFGENENLFVYIEAFQRAGFDDLKFILSMDREEWQTMIDAVETRTPINHKKQEKIFQVKHV